MKIKILILILSIVPLELFGISRYSNIIKDTANYEFNNFVRHTLIRDVNKELTLKFPVLFYNDGDICFRNYYAGKYLVDLEDSLIAVDNISYGISSENYCLLFFNILSDGYVAFWKKINGHFVPNFNLKDRMNLAYNIIKVNIDQNLYFEIYTSYVTFGAENDAYYIYQLDTLNNFQLVFKDNSSNRDEKFTKGSFISKYNIVKDNNDVFLLKETTFGGKKQIKKKEMFLLKGNKFVKNPITN